MGGIFIIWCLSCGAYFLYDKLRTKETDIQKAERLFGNVLRESNDKTELIAHGEKCGASWQTSSDRGIMFRTQCRICGVYVTEGGTPKCKR